MSRRKMKRAERKLLKRRGYSRDYVDMGTLTCALEEAKYGDRPEGYIQQPDSFWGKRTRRRVRRERWNRRARCLRRMLLLTAVYVGSLVVVLLLVGGLWELVLRFVG